MTRDTRTTLLSLDEEPTILGTQFFPTKEYTPDQKLLWAALENWFKYFSEGRKYHHTPTGKEMLRQERAWINSNRKEPITFLFICAGLCIDPEYFREKVSKLPDQWENIRRGPLGEILPSGVIWNRARKTKVYQVSEYDDGRIGTHRFDTLKEAREFYLAYKLGRKK